MCRITTPTRDYINPQYSSALLARHFYYHQTIKDIPELELQPDLKEFLTANFEIVAETKDYLIFGLKTEKTR